MLINTVLYLKKCLKLKEFGLSSKFEVGDVVARAFADLGIEEFLILPNHKLLSIYTGSLTDFNLDNHDFLFRVYDQDDLLKLLRDRLDFKLFFSENNNWEIEFNFKKESNSILKDLLIDVLIKTYE